MRSYNVARNAAVGILCQGFNLLLTFVVRTVFINVLTDEYLGITALFTSILSILSLSELGLSSAITFALYKPIAESDKIKIMALMRFYRKAYIVVGTLFLTLGVALIPMLPYLMNGSTNLVNIYIIYGMYLAQMVFSYWFLAYKSVLLTASQKEYLVSISGWCIKTVAGILQIIFILWFNDNPELAFYVYSFLGALTTLATNILTAHVVDELFPYLKDMEVNFISKTERMDIFKNMFGVAIYRISNVVNYSLDSIIVSTYIGLATVGIYSNYVLINKGISTILGAVFNPFTASIGDLNASETKEKKEFVFNTLNLLFFWICGLCGVFMWVLFNPFIGGLWLDNNWIFTSSIVVAMVLKFWVDAFMGAVIRFREASGLFWNTRYRYILTPLVNVSVSLYLVAVCEWGILGVLIGSISSECIMVIIDPIIVFRNVFIKSPKRFYVNYFAYMIVAIVTALFTEWICSFINLYTMAGFFLGVLACLLVPNVFWYLLYSRSKEFLYLQTICVNITKSQFCKK
ncbi:lipopolysaccharide biosynthesis protein [Selenomonas ruminantium]|uniref:lipopolysaccharide biosynthesis protein n=1 Tax=Selenomonas ruminantium TaxID=971 RepID=UPI0026EC6E73|nr:oligosaccharide flippase family protein [Selenomonas ruminantium]